MMGIHLLYFLVIPALFGVIVVIRFHFWLRHGGYHDWKMRCAANWAWASRLEGVGLIIVILSLARASSSLNRFSARSSSS